VRGWHSVPGLASLDDSAHANIRPDVRVRHILVSAVVTVPRDSYI
jgi:hypothetical protein